MLFPVLSIRQPWAWLILQDQFSEARKDVENRSKKLPEKYIDTPVLIHTSAKPAFDLSEARREMISRLHVPKSIPLVPAGYCLHGHIIGVVRFSGCERNCSYNYNGTVNLTSPWIDVGAPYWWQISKAKPISPMPAKGQLGFWKFFYPYTSELEGF